MTVIVILNYMNLISTNTMYLLLITIFIVKINYLLFWKKIKIFPKFLMEKRKEAVTKTQVSTQQWVNENCNCPTNYNPLQEDIDYQGYKYDNMNLNHNFI